MIADVVNLAITGIGFCHAASRLIFRKGFTARMNVVVTQKWNRWLDRSVMRNISALTKDF
jgi:hypothetical protein